MTLDKTQAMRAYREHVDAIGQEKWTAKLKRGVIALVLLACVVAEVWKVKLGIPWYVLVGMVFMAGIMFSPDLWKAPLKVFVAGLKDLVAIVRGKNGTT